MRNILHRPRVAYAEAVRRIERAYATSAHALNLADLVNLEHLPEDIRSLIWLESLSLGSFIGGTNVEDIHILIHCKSLQRLHLGRTRVSDITPVSELKGLKSLHLPETRVSDLSPLLPLSKLERLNVYGTRVTDLLPISLLPHLIRLDIRRSAVTDLTPLARTPSLIRGAEQDKRDGLLFSKEELSDPILQSLAGVSNPQRTRKAIELLRRQLGLPPLGKSRTSPDEAAMQSIRAGFLANRRRFQDALQVLDDAVASRPRNRTLRRERDSIRRIVDAEEMREEQSDENTDEGVPSIETIPLPERRAIQFTSEATSPIDLAPAAELGEHLQDNIGRRQDYTELRSKAETLKELGANRLGRANVAVDRFLLLPEQPDNVRLKIFWSRMNTLRVILADHEQAGEKTTRLDEPDERTLEPTVASHLKDLVETLNIFAIGDPGLMELDAARPGPQDIDAAREEVTAVKDVVGNLDAHPGIASEGAQEALKEQMDNLGDSSNTLSGRLAIDFARRSIRNFVGELLRRAYYRARALSRVTKSEADSAWKGIREGAYRAVGAALVAGVGTDLAGATHFFGNFVVFVKLHAATLTEYCLKAFNNPQLSKVIEWIIQFSS